MTALHRNERAAPPLTNGAPRLRYSAAVMNGSSGCVSFSIVRQIRSTPRFANDVLDGRIAQRRGCLHAVEVALTLLDLFEPLAGLHDHGMLTRKVRAACFKVGLTATSPRSQAAASWGALPSRIFDRCLGKVQAANGPDDGCYLPVDVDGLCFT